ncbi:restriction endonuclease [Streptomyces avermitilis]|uniref:restriction endonuclease n=1 Tax=Streptomyces avermitilis TaxID=33903 RepID=UPI00371C97B6
MATPVRRIPPVRRRRAFDLRSTALFFVLLAVVLSVAGFAVRAAARVVEQRPGLVMILCLIGVPAAVVCRQGRGRFSAARAARRVAAALDDATHTALDALETAQPVTPAPAPDRLPTPVPTPRDATVVILPGEAEGTVEHEAFDYDALDDEALDYDALDADEFEQAVAALCERDGCSDVEVVGGAGDLGADVVATAPDGRRVIIQCKRYCDTNKVGSQDLQRFGGTCFTVHRAEVAVVITTSDFTTPATEYADQCGILCFDRQALQAWSDGTGPQPWGEEVAVGDPWADDGALEGPCARQG